jgi:hypothetical protein
MGNLSKKELEEHYFNRFINHPDVKLEIIKFTQLDNDPPDFEFETFNGNKISVEMTNIMNPKLKALEEAQRKVVSKAQAKFKKKRVKDFLRVLVGFRPLTEDVKLTPAFIEKNADDLFKIVLDVCLRNEHCTYRVKINEWPYFHDFFREVTVSNELNWDIWQPFGSFIVPHIDQNTFSQSILSKEKKLHSYIGNYQENWLLLTTNFGHKSTAYRYDMLEKNFGDSDFDKIFILKDGQYELITIK